MAFAAEPGTAELCALDAWTWTATDMLGALTLRFPKDYRTRLKGIAAVVPPSLAAPKHA